jgi:hypothetical protein
VVIVQASPYLKPHKVLLCNRSNRNVLQDCGQWHNDTRTVVQTLRTTILLLQLLVVVIIIRKTTTKTKFAHMSLKLNSVCYRGAVESYNMKSWDWNPEDGGHFIFYLSSLITFSFMQLISHFLPSFLPYFISLSSLCFLSF